MSMRMTQHPVDAAKLPAAVPDRDYGFFFPRWPVLAAILLVPTGIIGEVIKAYFDTHACRLGSVCTLDAPPAPIQVLIVWSAFLGLWGIAFALGHGPLAERVTDHTRGPIHPVPQFFWQISHFERVTPFIYGFGICALLGMIVAAFRNLLDPSVFALGMVVLIVAVVTLAWWLRLLWTPYQRPLPAMAAVPEPETDLTDDAPPLTAEDLIAPTPSPVPNYAAMPNYGDIAPSQYMPHAAPTTGGATMLPSGLPSAPRLDSLEPPPNPNIDPALYASPATAPLPPSPNHDAGGTSSPLPPQMAPLHSDTEAH